MKAFLAAFLLLTSPALASPCSNMPPLDAQRPPTVPYEVITAPANQIADWCHKDAARMTVILYGCTFLPSAASHNRGIIVLNDALSPTDRACVLIYEKSHLEPNNWSDPVIEASAPNATSMVHL